MAQIDKNYRTVGDTCISLSMSTHIITLDQTNSEIRVGLMDRVLSPVEEQIREEVLDRVRAEIRLLINL